MLLAKLNLHRRTERAEAVRLTPELRAAGVVAIYDASRGVVVDARGRVREWHPAEGVGPVLFAGPNGGCGLLARTARLRIGLEADT